MGMKNTDQSAKWSLPSNKNYGKHRCKSLKISKCWNPKSSTKSTIFGKKTHFWCLKIFSKSSLWQSIGMPRTHKQLPLKAGIAMAMAKRRVPKMPKKTFFFSAQIWDCPIFPISIGFFLSNCQESNEISTTRPFFFLPWIFCGAAVTKNSMEELEIFAVLPTRGAFWKLPKWSQQPKNTWFKARAKPAAFHMIHQDGKLP